MFCDHSGLYLTGDSIETGREVGVDMQQRFVRTGLELGMTTSRPGSSAYGTPVLTTTPHNAPQHLSFISDIFSTGL